jgi:hypothetical protein
MNTYTQETFQKYTRKSSRKHSFDSDVYQSKENRKDEYKRERNFKRWSEE